MYIYTYIYIYIYIYTVYVCVCASCGSILPPNIILLRNLAINHTQQINGCNQKPYYNHLIIRKSTINHISPSYILVIYSYNTINHPLNHTLNHPLNHTLNHTSPIYNTICPCFSTFFNPGLQYDLRMLSDQLHQANLSDRG